MRATSHIRHGDQTLSPAKRPGKGSASQTNEAEEGIQMLVSLATLDPLPSEESGAEKRSVDVAVPNLSWRNAGLVG